MNKKKISKFTVFSIIFSASWILLTAVAGLILWDFLSVYEQSTPVYPGKQIVELYKNGQFNEVIEKCQVPLGGAFDTEMYSKYIESSLGENYDDVRVYEGIKDENGNRILEIVGKSGNPVKFYLTENPKSLKYGLSSFSIKQCEIETLTYKFTIPEEYEFTVNGKKMELDSKTRDVVENFDVFETTNNIPYTISGTVTGFIEEPTVELPQLDKELYTVKLENGEFTVTVHPNAETQKRVADRAEAVGVAFAKYLFNDGTYTALGKLSVKDSSSYIKLRTYDRMWIPKHSSLKIENTVVDNFIQYSHNSYSADVKFDYSLVSKTGQRKSYPCNYCIYLIDDGEELKMAAIGVN